MTQQTTAELVAEWLKTNKVTKVPMGATSMDASNYYRNYTKVKETAPLPTPVSVEQTMFDELFSDK